MEKSVGIIHIGQSQVSHHHRVTGILVGAGDLSVGVDAEVFIVDVAVHIRGGVHVFARVSIHTHVHGIAHRVGSGRLHGQPDGHQCRAGVAHGGSGVTARSGVGQGAGQKAVDHAAAGLVHQVSVPELKVAHPGQRQPLDAVHTVDVRALGAHQEEAVSLDGAVRGQTRGAQIAGGHVQVDGAHAAAVADLLGVGAAGGGGSAGAGAEGVVDAPIGRNPSDRKKMAVDKKNGKRAVTHYRVLEQFGKFSYIECQLETGRTHQIRVHMASIGHPLLGDDVYGSGKSPFNLCGQTLHAGVLGFIHPTTKEYVEYSADLPEYFQKVISRLRNS